MSIFVSIVGYRDTELPKTVRNLIDNADDKESIFVGIVSQDLTKRHPSFPELKNIRQVNVAAKDSRGVGFARKIAMELYNDEDFFFQVDSHMRFAKGWDTKLKNMLKVAQTIAKTKKVILSQFPAPYVIHTNNKDFFPKDDKLFWSECSWSAVKNHHSGAWGAERRKMEDLSVPHKSHTVLAGLMFAPGRIVKEIPYDERICFMGEELCFAIRAYTRHWEIYAPNEMIAWHYYERRNLPKIWLDSTQERRWYALEKISAEVQKNVLLGREQGTFGIEDYDRYVEYQDMIGINFHEFYNSDILNYKENMSALVQEINFTDDKIRTNYCINEIHKECTEKDCQCDCHEGVNYE